MSADKAAFLRMMGITEDDIADPPPLSGKASTSGPSGQRGNAPATTASFTSSANTPSASLAMKRRAFLAEMGLNEAGMPLERDPTSTGTPPVAPAPSRSRATEGFSPVPSPPEVRSGTSVAPPQRAGNGDNPAERFKTAGNDAFEAGNFLEAIKLYTQAIELANASRAGAVFTAALYSNRSASYLQGAKQLPSAESAYEHALCDADEAVALRPDWFKGYSRQGDAFFKSMRYHQAAEAFEMALRLQPGNTNLANSLRESRERAKSDSQEQWQARRRARKQQHSLNTSGTLRHPTTVGSSVGSSSLGEPVSPASLGYEEGATNASSLNTTGNFGSVGKSSFFSGGGDRSAHELWSALKSEVERNVPEQVTGDDYRKQQLERFRQKREEKARCLFGDRTSRPVTATAEAVPISVGDRRKASSVAETFSSHGGSTPSDRRGSVASATSGERVGSQFIPEEFSSTAASAYQQRLLEQFRQRKMKT